MTDTTSPEPAAETAVKPSPLKSPRVRLVLALVLLAALVAGGWWGLSWWREGRFIEETNNAYLAADSVVVSPRVAGYVLAVEVAENRSVRAGDLLARIDPAPFEAAVAAARAELAQRQADLRRAEAEMSAQAAAIDEARAQAAVASSALDFARTDAERAGALAASGAGTAQRRDEAASARDQARGRFRASQASVRVAGERVGTLQAQRGQALAAIDAAEARLRAAEFDLAATEIRAARPGRIGDRTVQAGQFVQPATRLMTIVPTGDLYVRANFKETQLARIRPGQRVRVSIDALPDREIEGVVDSLAPGTGATFALLPPENATGNFTKIVQRVPLRIRLELTPEIAARLAPGLSSEVAVDTRGDPR